MRIASSARPALYSALTRKFAQKTLQTMPRLAMYCVAGPICSGPATPNATGKTDAWIALWLVVSPSL
jgi:hypothetical protein